MTLYWPADRSKGKCVCRKYSHSSLNSNRDTRAAHKPLTPRHNPKHLVTSETLTVGARCNLSCDNLRGEPRSEDEVRFSDVGNASDLGLEANGWGFLRESSKKNLAADSLQHHHCVLLYDHHTIYATAKTYCSTVFGSKIFPADAA